MRKINYIRSFFAAIILCLVLASGCKKSDDNMSTPSSSGQQASSNRVTIQGMAFSPSTITVTAGTTVTWTNSDNMAHTVTSDGGLFDSGSFSNGGTYSHTFSTAGSFAYHCTLHPSMKGTVVVQ